MGRTWQNTTSSSVTWLVRTAKEAEKVRVMTQNLRCGQLRESGGSRRVRRHTGSKGDERSH